MVRHDYYAVLPIYVCCAGIGVSVCVNGVSRPKSKLVELNVGFDVTASQLDLCKVSRLSTT